jgi:hypothetical protein
MPYLNGKRVTQEEWAEANGSSLTMFHTGPNGENPGQPVELDEETQAPKVEKKAGSRRSSKSKAKAAAAIATATGTELPDITGLDADKEDA